MGLIMGVMLTDENCKRLARSEVEAQASDER